MATGATEVIRRRLIDWQGAGWARVPALSGAEHIIDDLEAAGFKIVKVKKSVRKPMVFEER